jgi:hypothetical protein|tara:strand:- start:9843 stop:10352 length:510 start_codon:yes stop_codon:yes gene_type:complete
MALKADRHELDTDISFFYNEGTAERGGVVVLDTVGSGAAMDQAGAKVKYAVATNALFPVGILLNDVVNLDLTRQHINWHKDEVQKGGKVTVLKKGWVVTNLIAGTPAAGLGAFVDDGTAGYIATAAEVADGKYIQIGRFMSTKDEDGYAKVEVNLPMPVDNDAAASAPE